MINFLKNIFQKSTKYEDPALTQKRLFKQQVENALNKCKAEKKQEIENIDNIKKWAKDIILEIFDVPSAFWYEELKEYESIKFHENNLKISKGLVEKTDTLIEEYREQIKLSKSKIMFCDNLIVEYENIMTKHKKASEKFERIKNEDAQIKLLKKHRKRIAKMRLGNSNLNNIYEDTGVLETLNDEINNIEDDFRIKQEVSEYIENLDKEFLEDTENTNSLPIRNEIDKLTSEIKKK